MLALPLSDATLDSVEGQVLSSFTLHPAYIRRIEPAGSKFGEFYREKVLKYNKVEESSDEEETKTEEFSKDQIHDWEKKRHKKTQEQINKEMMLEENYYEILGLGETSMGSSESDIKKAYRKMALVYHPDKSASDATNPIWLKIQKAYETLIDPEKRKKYDSTLPFDETIPEENVDEKSFFQTFGPVFIRNSLYSVKRPVPDLGNDNTDMKQVYKFYEFWEKFDSWRDFSVFDEYNLDEADSRYERRYMERENKRIKAEHLKKERQRIFKLVENAKKCDPRLIKIRKEEEEARMRAKLEKQMKKEQYKREQAEKEQKEEEAKLAVQKQKEEEEKRIEDEKKKVKDDQRKAIKDLRTILTEKVDSPKYDKFWLDGMLEKMKHEDVLMLKERLENVPKEKALDDLENFVVEFDKILADRKKALYKQDKEKAKQQAEEDKKARESQWTVEELSLLAKAIVKFPAGTKNRWGAISSFVGSKSPDEVLQKTKEMGQTQALKSTAHLVSKEAFSQLQKERGTKVIDAEPDKRIVFDQTNTKLLNVAEKKEETKIDGQTVTKPQTTESAKPKETEKKEETDSGWTQSQQQALEKALREFPSTMDAQERWTKIAEKVPGKTKKQCIERFKELRNAVKNKTG